MKKITLLPGVISEKSLNIAGRIALALNSRGFEAVIDRHGQIEPGSDLPSLHVRLADTDLLIVLGGDGSMISAARAVYPRETAMLGVNLGRLGFLADAQPEEADGIPEALSTGMYRLETRMMLEGDIIGKEGTVAAIGPALNEFAFLKKPLSRIVGLELKVDEEPVASYHCDGLIVATPTGSTAYSLSAGGPILNPTLEAMVVTPICAHSLNDRSIVLRGDEELIVQLSPKYGREMIVTTDGRNPVAIHAEDRVIIRRSAHSTRLLRLKKVHFYRSLWSRLGEAEF